MVLPTSARRAAANGAAGSTRGRTAASPASSAPRSACVEEPAAAGRPCLPLFHPAANRVFAWVMRRRSGRPLLSAPGVEALRSALLPLAAVVTPNLEEAALLLGRPVASLEDAREAARALCDLGPRIAVVTGGHLEGAWVVDVVCDAVAGGCLELEHPRVAGSGTHGTGCTLSAAVAAFLARGTPSLDAVASARAYVQLALLRAPGLGAGQGPLRHLPLEPP